MNTRGNLKKFSAACVLSVCAAAAVHAQDAACSPVNAAMKKYATTPNHTFLTQSGAIADGKSKNSETIFAGTTSYLFLDGQWIINPIDKAMVLQNLDDNARTSHCRLLRSESVITGTDKAGGISHMSLRVDYNAVQAPPGAKKITG